MKLLAYIVRQKTAFLRGKNEVKIYIRKRRKYEAIDFMEC